MPLAKLFRRFIYRDPNGIQISTKESKKVSEKIVKEYGSYQAASDAAIKAGNVTYDEDGIPIYRVPPKSVRKTKAQSHAPR